MSAARDKGTWWETAIANHLHTAGATHAERRVNHGSNDQGDIAGIPGLVIEAKNCRQADWGAWVNEAEREAHNHGPDTIGVLWTHRRGKSSPADGYVVMTGSTFTRLLHTAGYIPQPTTGDTP